MRFCGGGVPECVQSGNRTCGSPMRHFGTQEQEFSPKWPYNCIDWDFTLEKDRPAMRQSSTCHQDRRARRSSDFQVLPSETAVRERQKSAPCSQQVRLGLCWSRRSERTEFCVPDWKAALSWRLARLLRAPSHGKIPTPIVAAYQPRHFQHRPAPTVDGHWKNKATTRRQGVEPDCRGMGRARVN